MNKYHLYYKRKLNPDDDWGIECDIFISAYNPSDRVKTIHEKINSKNKFWFLLPEYKFNEVDFNWLPNIHLGIDEDETEFDYIIRFFKSIDPELLKGSIVIDITGFIGHYVLALVIALKHMNITDCDIIYGEPLRYSKSERTKFSDEAVLEVKQAIGFEGIHSTESTNDLLILGVGYDFRLISEVASQKEHSHKLLLFGLPSLRPDMFQESLLQASKVSEAVGPEASEPQHFHFAPAFDPFMTASKLSDMVTTHRLRTGPSNIYLAPLATKAQALGFALFYLSECIGTPTSIIFPYCAMYMKETSEGLAGAWIYHLEL